MRLELDAFLQDLDLGSAARAAAAVEARGYPALWVPEAANDSFLTATAALAATSTLRVGTAVTVALSRSPMLTAYAAWALAGAYDGRFTLGLGAGGDVAERFGLPVDRPTARLEEYVEVLRHAWAAWRVGAPVAFRGRMYDFAVSQSAYRPAPHEHEIPVLLAAVGPRMSRAAGRLADGLVLHPLATPRTWHASLGPALAEGLAAVGRDRAAVEVIQPVLLVVADRPDADRQRTEVRRRIAWYGAREQYGALLRAVGLGDLATELRAAAASGRRHEWERIVDDDVLATFAVVADAADVPRALTDRFGGHVDRVSLFFDRYAGVPGDEARLLAGLAGAAP